MAGGAQMRGGGRPVLECPKWWGAYMTAAYYRRRMGARQSDPAFAGLFGRLPPTG